MPDVVVDVLTPGDGQGDDEMASDATIATAMEATILTSQQGHVFVMESGRLANLEGKMGAREGLTHRVIGESGGGQSRSQQPAGEGGTPT